MDFFQDKNIFPMLISQMQDPFDDPEWIYELKLDGLRCIAYLEKDKVILRNKRNMELLPRFIELKDIYRQATDRCILDGELVVLVNGVPDFYELQKRTMLTNKTKIKLEAARLPASFVAFDCLQAGDKVLLDMPLMERKQILEKLIQENDRMAISRYIPEKGVQLFRLTLERKLEGVVAKKASSLYFQGKRTKDWIKFKHMADKDFLICGYVPGKTISLILGEYRNAELEYAGTVSWGVNTQRFGEIIKVLEKGACPFREYHNSGENIVWCKPEKTCIVEYMPNTMDALRQPVFKGIRDDV